MRRHGFDPFSLLFGALFVSIGVAFLTGSTIAEAWSSIWPMVAVVVGLTLAAWAAVSAFRELRPAPADTIADDVAASDADDVAASVADDAVADETLER
jgi:hypothetical protein